MRLQYNKKTENPVLFIIESTYNKKTKKRSSRVVERLGRLSDIALKYDTNEPLAWAEDYVRKINLKIEEKKYAVTPKFSNNTLIKKNQINHFNVGYLFLQSIYHKLKLDILIKKISDEYKFEYDLDKIFSTLILARVINPCSKRSTCNFVKKFIEEIDLEKHQVYRALDVIAEQSQTIQTFIFQNSEKVVDRNISVLYFDCTNFYCETNITDGFREYGFSKENRKSPIIGMALFIDADGIPLAMQMYPGNQNEQLSLKPLERQIMKEFSNAKFVVVSDAGLNSDINKKFHMIHKKEYISVQPIKKLKGFLKKGAIDPKGWKLIGDDKEYNLDELDKEKYFNHVFYKERWKNENGFEERIIVSFSFKYQDFKRKNRAIIIENANKTVEKNNKKKDRYINEFNVTDDGEIADNLQLSLNEDAIKEDEKFDGFYAVTTSLKWDIEKIIKTNKQRWQIEESFKILKSELSSRKAFLTNSQRLKAHFLICFIALFFIRTLEKKLDYKYNYSEIIKTLRDLNLTKIENENYVPSFTRTDLTDDLQRTFGFIISKNKNLRLDTEIIDKRKIKNIIKFSKK